MLLGLLLTACKSRCVTGKQMSTVVRNSTVIGSYIPLITVAGFSLSLFFFF